MAAFGNWEERYAIICDYDVTAAEARIYAADRGLPGGGLLGPDDDQGQ